MTGSGRLVGGALLRCAVAGVAAAALVVSCSAGSDSRSGEPATAGDVDGFHLVARSQSSPGPSLVLDEVVVPAGGGFVGVHADGGGAPGERVAVSGWLEEGASSDLQLALDASLPDGTVWVMGYDDADTDTNFDDTIDQPATTGGAVVVIPMEMELTNK